MNRHDSIMALGIALSGLILLPIFVAPWIQAYAIVASVIATLYFFGIVYWCWRIYITASALIEPADPAQGRKPVFAVAGVGGVALVLVNAVFGLADRSGLSGVIANVLGLLVALSFIYAIWLTAKAMAGIPARRFALLNNAAMLAFLQIFYLPFGLVFMRRRLSEIFPD